MKATWFVQVLLAWLASAAAAAQTAQPPGPLARFDLHASVAWASVSADTLKPADDWDSGVAQGIVGAGWYWSDHLKTEVDVRFASTAEFYHFDQSSSAGRITYRGSTFRLRSSTISVGQHYQFFRNAWVHPYLGGGVDLRRESLEAQLDPVVVYDESSRDLRQVEAGRRVGPSVAWTARPFALVGVKAYLSPRAFFRTDLRVGFGMDVEQVVLSAGFGVDY